MAAKQSYHVPYSLAQDYMDMSISISSKDGAVARVLPMVVVSTYVLSALACMFILMKTFIGTMSSLPQKILFVILWVALTVCLATFDGTRRMNLQRVPTLFNYLPRRSRHVFTRTNHDAGPFFNILGIDNITDDGLLTFTDGTFGYWYRVTGSASVLLFDADRDAIITRVDNFYRKWDNTSEIVFMTTKEAQKVYRQVANLQRRYENIRNDDPDLRELAEEQFTILRDHIGSEFRSLHQYMLIKSKNKESLRVANGILQSEVENSSLMIKQCVPLDKTDVLNVLASIYQRSEF